MITRYSKFLESQNNSNDMWDIIPESVKELHKLFKSSGKTLFVVGGSVRDFLNNDKPKDFDLATDATPDEVLSIIGKKWRTTTQGESFFVVVVYTEDQPLGMEIATFREDLYGDLLGKTRNPVTKFSTIDKDVERRDLTWNALFYDLDKHSIIDLVGGLEDLKNGVTKFVGNPSMRITEDPLRIMRLIRFTSRYNYKIDQESIQAVKDNKDKLSIIVRERIWEEFYKSYGQVKDFTVYLNYLNKFGLWEYIFPGMKINTNILGCSSIELYLANLFFKNSNIDDVESLRGKLNRVCQIPDTTLHPYARKVSFLLWWCNFSPDKIVEYYSKRKSYQVDDSMLNEWMKITGVDGVNWQAFVKYKPTISSQELMSQGFKGKELGDEIKRLEIYKFAELLKR